MNISIWRLSPSIYNKLSVNDSVDPYIRLMLSTAPFTINILLGLPTNVYVSWLIVTGAGGLVASEFFALNLAVSDILYCLFSVTVLVKLHVSSNDILENVAWFASGILNSGRPLFQCCICLEHYLAVVHPVVFLRYRPLRYKLVCSGFIWMVVFGCALCDMVLKDEPMRNYYEFTLLLIVLSVKFFCSVAVLRALQRPGPGDGDKDRERMNTVKRKAFRIIVVILVAILMSYLPYMITLLLGDTLDSKDFGLAILISFCICVITGLVQPLLFLHRAGKIPCMREP